jgi:hypothetical protein
MKGRSISAGKCCEVRVGALPTAAVLWRLRLTDGQRA